MTFNPNILESGADSKSPVGTAYAFSPPSEEALNLSTTSHLLELASREFLISLNDTASSTSTKTSRVRRQALTFIDENGIRSTASQQESDLDLGNFIPSRGAKQGTFGIMRCGIHDEVLPCDPNNPYRTYSGWCNNIRNPAWGKSVITFDRMIPSVYADGISAPRSLSVVGTLLPSPRHISRYVHIDVSQLSNKHTLMLMQYGNTVFQDT
jgi:peroxidase